MTAIPAGGIALAFERVPALVEHLVTHGPYESADDVMDEATAHIAQMTDAERMALLNAHPPIGGAASTLSPLSAIEQGDDARADAELARLNEDYERRFGFRFVVNVAGRSRPDIVPALRERLASDRASELSRGIDEFLAIARARLR